MPTLPIADEVYRQNSNKGENKFGFLDHYFTLQLVVVLFELSVFN